MCHFLKLDPICPFQKELELEVKILFETTKINKKWLAPH